MSGITHRGIVAAVIFFGATLAITAQFKEIPPAPYTPAVARQKIRTLLENGDPGSQQQTAEALSKLLVWYRDLIDEELIAVWKGDKRANLPTLMGLLADSRVASAIVEFSWRQQRSATFNLTYAPMLGDLMARYPESADPFIRDLAGPAAGGGQMPDLSQPEAEAVCKILLDMPDTGDWRKIALQVLPHYRLAAERLLVLDLHGDNKEKIYRAQVWLTQLRFNAPGLASDHSDPRGKLIPRTSPVAGPPPVENRPSTETFSGRPHIVEEPSAALRSGEAPVYPSPAAAFALPYTGPSAGTLRCSGPPILPNAEYVFPGMPPGNLQIDLDGKPWAARLVPGKNQTQDLILTNIGASPQKRCTVRWSINP
jgi:hypothetical protein